MEWLLPAAGAPAFAALVATSTGPVLRRLPEPDASLPDATRKTPYRALATPRFVTGVGIAALVAGVVVLTRVPPPLWVAWAALTGPNVLACAIDARTTWLPRPLSHAGLLVAGVGACLAAALTASPAPLVGAVVAGLLAWLFFHLVWRITGALGYGDVRLAATIAAVAGATAPTLVLWSLFAGTLAGALSGIVHRLTGRTGPFPYGPGLLVGPFLALLLPGVT